MQNMFNMFDSEMASAPGGDDPKSHAVMAEKGVKALQAMKG